VFQNERAVKIDICCRVLGTKVFKPFLQLLRAKCAKTSKHNLEKKKNDPAERKKAGARP
jgi:hypothetical protein